VRTGAAGREDDRPLVRHPARPDLTRAPAGAEPERDLLQLSCRQAWTVSVGACARQRELRELSRSARLEPRADAQSRQAPTLPAVPRGVTPSHEPLRT